MVEAWNPNNVELRRANFLWFIHPKKKKNHSFGLNNSVVESIYFKLLLLKIGKLKIHIKQNIVCFFGWMNIGFSFNWKGIIWVYDAIFTFNLHLIVPFRYSLDNSTWMFLSFDWSFMLMVYTLGLNCSYCHIH